MRPQVSILLPTHNRADVLGYAIQSVLAQTVADFELLIVGDGCTDTTREIVGAFADPRIRWFDLPKTPFSGYANRNIALRQACGTYVAYAQHDDLWFADHVDLLVNTLQSAGADWAYSRPLWVGPSGVMCPSAVNLTLDDELDRFLHVENDVPSTCVMHLRSALERVDFWPEDVPRIADWRCWQRIISTSASLNAGYCRVPTSLHFRAASRQDDTPLERALRESAESSWWPPVLRHPPAAGPEQATMWRALSDGGSLWADAVRDATQTVMDRVAWMALRELLPRAEWTKTAHQAAEAAAAASRVEADAAIAEAQRVRVEADITTRKLLLRIEAAETAQWEAEAAAALTGAQAEQARAEIAALCASKSWRFTRPLRTVASALRR